jgi:hypothetical protein
MSQALAKTAALTTKIEQAAVYALGQVGLSLERRVKQNLFKATHGRNERRSVSGDGGFPERVTGNLGRSVFTELRNETGSYVASVFPTMVYARALELGNPKRWKSGVRYPYLKPSFDQERPQMNALFVRKFAERMR